MSVVSQQNGGANPQAVTSVDPIVASNQQNVLAIADATSFSGKFAALIFAAKALLNAGGTYDRARSTPGATGVQAVSPEGTKNTYCIAVDDISLAATATDFFTITGSGTKTVRILKITISGICTSGSASPDVLIIVRSTANSGGTSSTPTPVPNDSNNAAATCTINLYTANPTLGASVGTIRARKLNLGAAGEAGSLSWQFSDVNDQAIVLRGVNQVLALNFNAQAVPSGTSLDIEVEFVEDNS